MSKTTFILSLVLLIAGFLYWFNQTTEVLEMTSPAANPAQSSKSPLPSLQEVSNINSDLKPDPEADDSSKATSGSSTAAPSRNDQKSDSRIERRHQLFSEVVELEQELEEARSELFAREERLNALKEEYQQVRTLSGSSTSQQIEAKSTEVHNLSSLLESYRAAEDNISRRAEAAANIQAEATQLEKTRIEEQIRDLEISIQQTQREIQEWSQNLYDLTLRDVRLAELRAQLNSQTQTLQNLRNQRVLLSEGNFNQTQTIYSSAQSEQEALAQSQAALQEEILERSNEIQRLQQTQNQAEANANNLSSQILQAEKNIEQQRTRVQEIEESLRKKRQQLRSI